jgi:hypothetical protein
MSLITDSLTAFQSVRNKAPVIRLPRRLPPARFALAGVPLSAMACLTARSCVLAAWKAWGR